MQCGIIKIFTLKTTIPSKNLCESEHMCHNLYRRYLWVLKKAKVDITRYRFTIQLKSYEPVYAIVKNSKY